MTNQGLGFGFSWQHLLTPALSIQPSIKYMKENANDSAFTNNQISGGFLINANLPWEVRFSEESTYTHAKYSAAESWALLD